MRWIVVSIISGLCWLSLWTVPVIGQGYQCRTSPVGASTSYCASEAFVTQSSVHGPGSSTAGNLPTFSDATGKTLQDSGVAITGVFGNVADSETGNVAITSGSGKCGQLILASGGLNTITLSAPSGFPANCVITIKNNETYTGSTGRAKILSGFPADVKTRLWPLQVVQVGISGGAWVSLYNPPRWMPPTFVTLHVDATNGNNANDGLASGAGNALADAQAAWNIAQYQMDTQATTPIIAMACSETHTVALNSGGTPLGSNLIQVSPDGNCSFTWSNANACLDVADLSEINLDLNYYGSSGVAIFACNTSNTANVGNIYLHNQVVLDLEGTPVWNPAGGNDNFLYCDGPCVFTVANGVTQATAAGGNYIIVLSETGKGTQSGTISASASGSANGVYWIFGGMLILGTSNGGGWAGLGTSKIYANGVLVTNGVTIAGGTSHPGSGVVCVSLADSTC